MKIVVADDHPIYLEALAVNLSRIFDDASILLATGIVDLLKILRQAEPTDLVVTDFSMPGMKGIPSVREIVAAARGAPVAVISGIAHTSESAACIAAGARGFLPKTLDRKLFRSALTLIAAGETYIPSEILPLLGKTRHGEDCLFTPRELLVIKAFVEGKSNKEIASLLNLAEVTIKLEISHIFDKLGARNRAHAVALVFEKGVLPAT